MLEEWRFLDGPAFLLRFVNLYNEPPIKFATFQIPWNAVSIFVFATLMATSIPSVANCVLNVTDFVSLLPAILVVSSNFSINAIYVFCLWNRSFIIELVNKVDKYVQHSECKPKKSRSYPVLWRKISQFYFFSFSFFVFWKNLRNQQTFDSSSRLRKPAEKQQSLCSNYLLLLWSWRGLLHVNF